MDTRQLLALTAAGALTIVTGTVAAAAEFGPRHQAVVPAASRALPAGSPATDAPATDPPGSADGAGQPSTTSGEPGGDTGVITPAPPPLPITVGEPTTSTARARIERPATTSTSAATTTTPSTRFERPSPVLSAATFTTARGEGAVQVRCTAPESIALVAATPGSGYRAQLGNTGPEEVEVAFLAVSHDSQSSDGEDHGAALHATCRNGQPVLDR